MTLENKFYKLMQKNPIVLLILDGFGHSDDQEYNAIAQG